MRKYFHRYQLIPLAIVSLGAGLLFYTSQLQEPTAFQQISAKVWPFVLSIALLICGALIFLENAQEHVIARDRLTDEDEKAAPQGWLLLLLVLASAPLMYLLGYWAVGVLLIVVVALMIEGFDNPWRLTIFALVLPTVIYLLFTRVVGQYLPAPIFM